MPREGGDLSDLDIIQAFEAIERSDIPKPDVQAWVEAAERRREMWKK